MALPSDWLVFDFATADNAPVPHVTVYVIGSRRTVCEIPILEGNVTLAEELAEIFINALNQER